MQLSTRGRYAIMALLDMADMQKSAGNTRPITLMKIAERQDISLSYLEQLFANLRKSGVVKSMRGPGGGYIFSKEPEEVFLGDVVRAVNEPMTLTRCTPEQDTTDKTSSKHPQTTGCVHAKKCNAHDLWRALGDHISVFLDHTSLAMVMEKNFIASPLPSSPTTAERGGHLRVVLG